jgi:hypothetical protein
MNPTPNASQEPLRDARLAMAWQHMPDAHMLPSDSTRQSVLQAGKQAVKTPGTVGLWWQRLMRKPHHRAQWTTAVASVLVASFITVMWYGTNTPEASPDEAQVADQSKESRVESTANRAATPATKPAQAPAKQAKTAPIDTQADEAEVAAPAKESVAAGPAAAPPPPATTAAPSESMTGNEAALARSAPATSPATAPAPAPAPMVAPAAAKANAAGPSMADISTLERKKGDATAASALVVTLDGQPAKISAQQASQLLAALHALPYESFDETAHQSTKQVTLTVQTKIGEVWRVAPDRVEARSASTAPALVIHINPEQYQLLRRLAGSEAAP